MTDETLDARARKLCFVTVGATAPFHALVRSVLRPEFLQALAKSDYTDLLIQCGKGGEAVVQAAVPAQDAHGTRVSEGVRIACFAFRDNLYEEYKAARGAAKGFGVHGCIVSHAGTGSVLDGMRQQIAMVVVANPALLDNHQEELAAELARLGYVVHGRLASDEGRAGAAAGAVELARAVDEVEALRAKLHGWPPVNSRAPGQARRTLQHVMDEEMGFSSLD